MLLRNLVSEPIWTNILIGPIRTMIINEMAMTKEIIIRRMHFGLVQDWERGEKNYFNEKFHLKIISIDHHMNLTNFPMKWWISLKKFKSHQNFRIFWLNVSSLIHHSSHIFCQQNIMNPSWLLQDIFANHQLTWISILVHILHVSVDL